MSKLKETVAEIPTGSTNYPEKEYARELRIQSGVSNILRFLDGNDSFVTYYMSWIFCDDDVIRPFIVGNEKEGPSILSRMFGDKDNYFSGGYLESKKGKDGKLFTYQQKDPELFKIMTEYWNPAYEGAGTCKPQKEFIFNVIHRNPEPIDNKQAVWCYEEKHTKILRFRQKALEALSVVSDNDGDVKDYDINYVKQGKGVNTTNSMLKAGVNVPNVKIGLLSEEEQNYERYTLLDIVKSASAFYCLKHIPSKIKRMDAAMGTNFYAEFEKQKEIENIEWKKRTGQDSPDSNTPSESSRISMKDSVQVFNCEHCDAPIPVGSAVCPKCHAKLMEPCNKCFKPFSIKDKVCPYCGEKYQ